MGRKPAILREGVDNMEQEQKELNKESINITEKSSNPALLVQTPKLPMKMVFCQDEESSGKPKQSGSK